MRKKHSVMLIAVLAMILCLTMAFGITAFADGEESVGNPETPVETVVEQGCAAPAQEAAPANVSAPESAQTDNAPQDNAPAQEASPVQEVVPVQEVIPTQEETPAQEDPQAEQQTTPASDAPVEEAQQNEQEPGQEPAPEADVTETELPTQPIDEEPSQEPVEETATEPAEQQQDEENPAGEEPANESEEPAEQRQESENPAGEEPANEPAGGEQPAAETAETVELSSEEPVIPAPAEPVKEAEQESGLNITGEKVEPVLVEDATGIDGTINYVVTITDTNGNSVDVAGGKETVISSILRDLGYEIGEDTIIEVDMNSVDTGVINVSDSANGPVLTDNGPFGKAAKNLIVYVNGEAVELELVDPIAISGSRTAADVQQAFSDADDGNVKLAENVTLSDAVSIRLLEGTHDLYLNGFTLTGKTDATTPMFVIKSGVTLNVYGGDGKTDGEGQIISTSTIFEIQSGGEVTFSGGVKLNGQVPTRETITPPSNYTTDEHGLMAYNANADNGYDFQGYVNNSWRQVTYWNDGFYARAYNAEGYTVTAVPSFVADGKAILMTCTITANSAAPNLRFFIAADTMIAGNDASANSVDDDNVIKMTDNKSGVSLFGFSTTEGGIAVATEYSRSTVSYYDVVYGNGYPRIYADPSTVTPVETAYDSAFVLYFPVVNFAAGDSKDYTFVIGMGGPETIDGIVEDVKAEVLNSRPNYEDYEDYENERLIVTTTDSDAIAVAEVTGSTAQILLKDETGNVVDPVNVTILEPAKLIAMGAKTAEIRMTENLAVVLDIEAAMCGKAECVITVDNVDGVITVACDGVKICEADFTDIAESIAKLVYDGKTLKAYDAQGNLIREYEVN